MKQAVLPLEDKPAASYGALRSGGSRWIMEGVPPHVAIRLKAIFPRIPKAEAKKFSFDHSPIVCADLAWFLDRYPMTMTAQDRAKLAAGRDQFEREAAEIGSIMAPTWRPSEPIGFKDGKRPFHFQQRPIEVAARMGRLLVLDEGGLGKTITGIGAILRVGKYPAAAVVQPHLATQWRDKIREFSSLRTHIINSTTPYTLPPADVYIWRYSNIAAWIDVVAKMRIATLLFDEIQELRHGQSTGKGAAAKVFTEAADLIVGLTATPIYNYGSEIFNVIEYIAPGLLGSWHEFLREWCKAHGTHWVVADPAALGTYLREQNLAIRRTYDDDEVQAELGDALPKANTIPIEVEHDEKVEADAFDLCRKLAIKVTSGSFTERGQAARELDATVRRITGVAKARHVAAYVRMLLAEGEPVLLAGWHREVYDIWRRELSDFEPLMYTGSESTAEKDKARDLFISGERRLMLISLRSGAGLDGLQHVCNTLVVGELDYSPQVHEQLIWRLRRLGQKRWPVTAIFLHSNGGSDPTIINILGLKASQSRGITDPMAGVETIVSDDSRIKMIAQRYLERAVS